MPEKIDPKREQLIQQKYAELYQLDMSMKQLQQQIEGVHQQMLELEAVMQNLDSLKDIDKNEDSACMFTPGIFVKTKITDTEKVFLNVGAGTVVEKTVDEAKNILKSQTMELTALEEELMTKLDEFTSKAQNVQEEFTKL